MKLTRKLIAAVLCMCMAMSLATTAFAAELKVTYDKASYYDIAVTTYSRMLSFQNGGVVIAADQSKKYGLIDATGKTVLPFEYVSVKTLSDGLFAASQKVNDDGKPVNYGVIDATGKTILPFEYVSVKPLTGGLFAVAQKGDYSWPTSYGVVNTKGETLYAPNDECYGVSSQNGIIRLSLSRQEEGKTFPTSYWEYYTADWKPATENDYYGSSNYGGTNATPPELEAYSWYDKIGDYYRVTKRDENDSYLRGLLDSSYKEIVAPGDYRYVGTPNADGYVSATKPDGTTDLFKGGKVVKTFTDKQVTTEVYFRHLVFSTTNGSKYGLMDIDEKVLMEEKFSSILVDANNYICTGTIEEGHWEYLHGLYTQEGKQVFADEYSELSYMTDGKYRLHKGDYFGVSQVSGTSVTAVIPLKYPNMVVHTYQFIELYDGSKYSIVDLNNKVIVPESSEKINAFKGDPDGLRATVEKTINHAKEYDGYTKSVLPFLSRTGNGWVTVYADYETGEVTGQLNTRASNINGDGWFVYQDDTGLYGFARLEGSGTPSAGTTPAPASNTAYASTQMVEIDGKKVEFQMYALKDAAGNPTNYVKVRDLALALNGTEAQFAVEWDGAVNLVTGSAYAANGSENSTPFSGDRAYTVPTSATKVNGADSDLAAIMLTDDNGGGYTYYQLRDLGRKLGFNVSWSGERGVFVETDKPYTED